MIRFPLLLAAIAMPGLAHAQDQPAPPKLDLSGSVRLRYEAIGGQARVGFNARDDLFNARTTLAAVYEDGPLTLGAELYDSRVYGDRTGTPVTTGEVNALELVQAYATYRFGRKGATTASVQAGRFLLNLGSRRLVAADDYRNTTNSYTGVRVDLAAPGGVRAVAIYTLPQMRRPDDLASLRAHAVAVDRESFDLVLWGGIAARAKTLGAATLEATVFHLGERDAPGRPTRDRSLDTYGGRVILDPRPGRFDYEVEGFYQSGSIATTAVAGAPTAPVAAWFLHADAGYTFRGPWRPRVSVDYDRASGDAPGGAYGRFDPIFGMRRADLAPSGLYNAIARTNVDTPGVRVEVEPSALTDAFVGYRPMWLASRFDAFSSTGVIDRTGASGSFAGPQLDARIRHWLIPKRLRLELDAVALAKGRFLREAPNAPPGKTTRYLSANVTASF